MKKTIQINLVTLILAGLVILLGIGFGVMIYINKTTKLKDKIENEVKLRNALIDNVKFYQNKEKEWVAEKLTIQTAISNLSKMKNDLTESQLELLNRMKETNKQYTLIAAALIKQNIKIDSLLLEGETEIDTVNKEIRFYDTYKDSSKTMTYDFRVKNVMPSSLIKMPKLLIDSLSIPNTQYIDFKWKNDKKVGYPVSFSITNSNGFFQTNNIDSYIIPEISKEQLNPNFWGKIGNFFIRSGDVIICVGIGGIIGAGTVYFLTK